MIQRILTLSTSNRNEAPLYQRLLGRAQNEKTPHYSNIPSQHFFSGTREVQAGRGQQLLLPPASNSNPVVFDIGVQFCRLRVFSLYFVDGTRLRQLVQSMPRCPALPGQLGGGVAGEERTATSKMPLHDPPPVEFERHVEATRFPKKDQASVKKRR